MSNELGSASQLVFNVPTTSDKTSFESLCKVLDGPVDYSDRFLIYQFYCHLSKWLLSDGQLCWYPVSFLNSDINDYLAISRLSDKKLFEMRLNNFMFLLLFAAFRLWNVKKWGGGLTKSGITFVVLEIFCWNLVIMCRYELSLSL